MLGIGGFEELEEAKEKESMMLAPPPTPCVFLQSVLAGQGTHACTVLMGAPTRTQASFRIWSQGRSIRRTLNRGCRPLVLGHFFAPFRPPRFT